MNYASLNSDAGLALQHDILAFQAISRICDRFLPWTSSALRPAAVQIALNDILVNRRRMVVELGSGISTVFIAGMIAEQGGQLISVEHERDWIEQVRSWLTPKQRAVTTFVHAPLVARPFQNETAVWYDSSFVGKLIADAPAIDLLLIDGPPAYQQPHCLNRGPALDVLRPYLAASAAILLDDINRSGEQCVARTWSDQLGCEFRNLAVEAGIALWTLGSGNNISQ
ncbi:MAG TPA: class I SAM-dependent methyltransferase [Opitutaceae bacterium]|jgi:hypothetical protein